jgi:ATP/maltotriose-dependent transcriptional regulator MalT
VQAVCEEIGNRQQLASCLDFEGQVQRLAGNLDEAARLSREGYQAMAAIGDRSFASTIAVNLGEILIDLGQDDEAWRFGAIARDTSSSDDVVSQAGGRAVQARVLSRRGEHAAAEGLAREAADIMSNTDYFDQHAGVLVHLAHVLREADKGEDALVAAREALSLYELKGATFFVDQSQRLIDEWSADA